MTKVLLVLVLTTYSSYLTYVMVFFFPQVIRRGDLRAKELKERG